MFCFSAAAKKSLYELLLPACGRRYKSFSDPSIKVRISFKKSSETAQVSHGYSTYSLMIGSTKRVLIFNINLSNPC